MTGMSNQSSQQIITKTSCLPCLPTFVNVTESTWTLEITLARGPGRVLNPERQERMVGSLLVPLTTARWKTCWTWKIAPTGRAGLVSVHLLHLGGAKGGDPLCSKLAVTLVQLDLVLGLQ
jgi:hypothetical protein